MFRFLLLAVFAVVGVPNVATGLRGLPIRTHPSARSFDLKEICSWFCGNGNSGESYYDYDYFFRMTDHVALPRIFCGICDKKYGSSTTTTTSTTPSTTATSQTTVSSTTASATTSPPAADTPAPETTTTAAATTTTEAATTTAAPTTAAAPTTTAAATTTPAAMGS